MTTTWQFHGGINTTGGTIIEMICDGPSRSRWPIAVSPPRHPGVAARRHTSPVAALDEVADGPGQPQQYRPLPSFGWMEWGPFHITIVPVDM